MEELSDDGVLRELCVLFVKLNNLSGLDFDTRNEEVLEQVAAKIQKTVVTVQEAAYHGRATLRQFIVDDKGAIAIIVVGLPPVTAVKNSSRGLKIALRILENGIPAQIGVTTGTCFCGTIGSSTSRGDFAVVGDHINMAARLMAKAPQGKIFCDSNTMIAARNDKSLTFYDKRTLKVKGKSQPIAAYSPARKIQSVLAPVDFLSMQRSPLIGQVEVWKTLQFQHQFRNKSKPQLIQVLGPKSSGKTKLITMFSKTQQLERITCVTARADKFEETTPFFVFREILYNIFEHGVSTASKMRRPSISGKSDDGFLSKEEGLVLLRDLFSRSKASSDFDMSAGALSPSLGSSAPHEGTRPPNSPSPPTRNVRGSSGSVEGFVNEEDGEKSDSDPSRISPELIGEGDSTYSDGEGTYAFQSALLKAHPIFKVPTVKMCVENGVIDETLVSLLNMVVPSFEIPELPECTDLDKETKYHLLEDMFVEFLSTLSDPASYEQIITIEVRGE